MRIIKTNQYNTLVRGYLLSTSIRNKLHFPKHRTRISCIFCHPNISKPSYTYLNCNTVVILFTVYIKEIFFPRWTLVNPVCNWLLLFNTAVEGSRRPLVLNQLMLSPLFQFIFAKRIFIPNESNKICKLIVWWSASK